MEEILQANDDESILEQVQKKQRELLERINTYAVDSQDYSYLYKVTEKQQYLTKAKESAKTSQDYSVLSARDKNNFYQYLNTALQLARSIEDFASITNKAWAHDEDGCVSLANGLTQEFENRLIDKILEFTFSVKDYLKLCEKSFGNPAAHFSKNNEKILEIAEKKAASVYDFMLIYEISCNGQLSE
jgi:hypothetical protein